MSSLILADSPGNTHIRSHFFISEAMQLRIVNFDTLGPQFRISFHGGSPSGGQGGLLQFWIGGTRESLTDGDLAWSLTVGSASFVMYGYVSPPITNIWSGHLLFKAVAPDPGFMFAFTPTMILL